MLRTTLALVMISALVTSCSWKTYDQNKAQEYHDYWQKDENKKNSIIYSLTNEYNEEHRQKR